MEFSITPHVRDGFRVFVLAGDLALDSVSSLERALDGCTDELPVIVDLSAVQLIGSSGVHALLRTREVGQPVALVCAPSSPSARVLAIVQADLLVPVFDSLSAALDDACVD
jgi:anti-anti-sigma regulatory factor